MDDWEPEGRQIWGVFFERRGAPKGEATMAFCWPRTYSINGMPHVASASCVQRGVQCG
jgi:hypothetical protein